MWPNCYTGLSCICNSYGAIFLNAWFLTKATKSDQSIVAWRWKMLCRWGNRNKSSKTWSVKGKINYTLYTGVQRPQVSFTKLTSTAYLVKVNTVTNGIFSILKGKAVCYGGLRLRCNKESGTVKNCHYCQHRENFNSPKSNCVFFLFFLTKQTDIGFFFYSTTNLHIYLCFMILIQLVDLFYWMLFFVFSISLWCGYHLQWDQWWSTFLIWGPHVPLLTSPKGCA